MIKSYSLYTSKIDDPQIAVEEIQTQLTEISLLTHSVGIVVCHHDYVVEGTVRELKRALPFPILGLTTFYQMTPKISGLFELTVTVMTSDDVRFAVAATGMAPGDEDPAQFIHQTYQKAYAIYSETPAMVLAFMSVQRPVSGDEFLRMMDASSGGVPCFGGVTTGDDDTGVDVQVICEEETFNTGFVILLFIGDVRPRFYYNNFREEKLLEMIGTVTKAEGEIVRELNGQSAVPFLQKNGMPLEDNDRNIVSNVPFMYKMPWEKRMTGRTLGGFDEDGALRFLAEVPEKALLRMGTVSMEDILRGSHETMLEVIRENRDAGVLLIFSCVGRYITLGLSHTSEMEHVAEDIPRNIPFLANYVGGEICPVDSQENGSLENRYHNGSFVVCALT